VTLHLVRHGRPLRDPGRPASAWELDPAAYDDVWALRDRLPAGAAWCSSPEPKALATAELLTDGDIGVVDDLREHERAAGWLEDFEDRVRSAFADPTLPAAPGWEPLEACRDRVVPAVRRLLDVHADQDLVLVGHGTAWTVLAASLTGAPPDLARWAASTTPDLWTLDP
jgi:broad specificity phosphatase PhoE